MAEISRIERKYEKAWYEISWSDGHTTQFPFVFLFDNCRCQKCFHPTSYQRAVLMADLDPEIRPIRHEITQDGQEMQITWPNGHTSPYPSSWLKMHHFGKSYDPLDSIQRVTWGCEKAKAIPSYKYKDVMEDDKALYDWLASLLSDGITLLKETHGEEGVLAEIQKRISFSRTTIYGNVFNVITKYGACGLAYTGNTLDLHIDLPGYYYTPGVQMLHCIKQVDSDGGGNQFVDGMRVAEQLKRGDPEMWNILTSMKVDFRTTGADYIPYSTMTRRPVIELDRDGSFAGINYGNTVRAPYWSIPVEEITKGYKALKTFHTTMYSEENCINYKMEKGDMVVFDNRRVLHGRHSFRVEVKEGEESKMRHLEGGYLDWDEVKSKMRLIHEKLNGTPRF